MTTSSSPPALTPRERLHYRNFFIVGLCAVFLYLIIDFVAPLILGAVFAIVMYPIFKKFLSYGMKRTVAGLLVTFIFGVAFLIPVGGLIFAGADAGVDEIDVLKEKLKGSENQSPDQLIARLGLNPLMNQIDRYMPGDRAEFIRMVKQGAAATAKVLANVLKDLLTQIPNVMIASLVITFAVYYFLVDGERITRWLGEHSLMTKKNTSNLFETIHGACRSAILASVLTGLVQTAIMAIGCIITGVPNLLLVLLFTFITSFLPMLGTMPVTAVILLYFAVQSMWTKALVFLGIAVIIGVSDNFARPFFIGRGTEIHPLLAFVFTFGACATIGFYGLFIGPVAAGTFVGLVSVLGRGKTAEA